MRLLTFFTLLALLLHSSEAKKSEKKKEKEGFLDHAFSEVYEHTAEATAKLGKASSKVYNQAKQAIDSSGAGQVASDAFASAATAATAASQTIGQASASAYNEAKRVIESGEASQVASEAFAGAATVATDVSGKLLQASSDAYLHVKQAVDSGEASRVASDVLAGAAVAAAETSKTIVEASSSAYNEAKRIVEAGEVSQAASEALESAQSFSARFAEKAADLWKGRLANETYTEYVAKFRKLFTFKKEEVIVEDPVVRDDNSVPEAVEETVDEQKKDARRVGNIALTAAVNKASGVFEQINQARVPIYRHVSGGDWGMRQINEVGQAIYKPSVLGNAFSGVGKALWYFAAAAETLNVAEAAAKDLDEGTSNNTIHATSKAVLSWTLASTGASAGAYLGSVVPGVGTLAGGLIGGFLGAYSGSVAGEAAADAYQRIPKNANQKAEL